MRTLIRAPVFAGASVPLKNAQGSGSSAVTTQVCLQPGEQP
jgi:hypothetical protein